LKPAATIVTMLFLRDMGKTSGKLQTNGTDEDSPATTDEKASSRSDMIVDGASSGGGTREKDGGS
jgi:hypothetical protein